MAADRGSHALHLEPDPVIEAFKHDVDRTLLRENLERSPEQRVAELMRLLRADEEFRRAGKRLLIVVKRAAGRVRDLQAVADLEALLEERRGRT